eukprot:4965155-Pyramimonas_sp.AAC.2
MCIRDRPCTVQGVDTDITWRPQRIGARIESSRDVRVEPLLRVCASLCGAEKMIMGGGSRTGGHGDGIVGIVQCSTGAYFLDQRTPTGS